MNSTVDVPTQSGAAAPLIDQPGPPGAPGRAAPPSVAQTASQSQPKPQEQPREIAPLGVKMVEEQKMSMAPKTAVDPALATSPEVPNAPAMTGEGGIPAVASEPGTPGREIIARKAHLTTMGVSRTGIAAFNVEESPFGAYDKKIFKAVHHPPPGTAPEQWGMVLLGFAVSAVVSFIAVKWLLRYVQTHTFTAFGWYRIGLAVVIAIGLLAGLS